MLLFIYGPIYPPLPGYSYMDPRISLNWCANIYCFYSVELFGPAAHFFLPFFSLLLGSTHPYLLSVD